jgi:hypothetical protein
MEKRPSKFFLTSRRGGVIGAAIPTDSECEPSEVAARLDLD